MDCHEGLDTTLARTPHRLTGLGPRRFDISISCVDCHTGAQAHLDQPDTSTIGNPAHMPTAEVYHVCRDCHDPHGALDNVGLDPHLAQAVSCVSCHSVHQGRRQLLADDRGAFCERCHVAVATAFGQRSNHPLREGAVTCLSCHSLTGKNEPQYGHGPSANCYSCHPEQSGPYLYPHAATVSFAVEGGGCTECHESHGSPNERLLSRPGNTLCVQCHGVPPGHRTRHSGLGTKLACVDCHSEVHGSNHNTKLLDPDLGTKLFPDCYQSGCHIFGD